MQLCTLQNFLILFFFPFLLLDCFPIKIRFNYKAPENVQKSLCTKEFLILFFFLLFRVYFSPFFFFLSKSDPSILHRKMHRMQKVNKHKSFLFFFFFLFLYLLIHSLIYFYKNLRLKYTIPWKR